MTCTAFSCWIDAPPPGPYVQEHRPAPGLPADDMESLLIANPGAKHSIGSTPAWLQAQAERAIAMGGHALTSFRLYNRNERVSGEARDLLLTVDEWLSAEVVEPPHRSRPCCHRDRPGRLGEYVGRCALMAGDGALRGLRHLSIAAFAT